MSMDRMPPQRNAGGAPLPSRGSFAFSEVLPLVQAAQRRMHDAREEWKAARSRRDELEALAKKTRADLTVSLRVWGNEGTGGVPIKTSAERNEWADADADVQNARLEADLAQTLQMVAYEAYQDAQASFALLNGMLGIERDDNRAERGGPQ